MKTQALEALEFDRFRQILLAYAQTPLGHKELQNLTPSTDIETIRRSLEEVGECIAFQHEYGAIRINSMADPTLPLERLAIANTQLDSNELLQIQSIISIGHSIRQEMRNLRERFTHLYAVIGRLPDLSQLWRKLRETLTPSGDVCDDASPELRKLRREITLVRNRIYRKLEALMEQAGSEGAVRDEFVTQRNGRFVIPVRHDFRGRVPGVVHGVSSSGATAFVEPIAAIEENNELVRLRELEAIEVAKVLFSLSEEVRKELPAVRELITALAHLDTIVAKANFAKDYNCIKPKMNTEGHLELVDARHPILEYTLRQVQGQVVPISFQLNANSSAMVISGPNAGGKTVVLKTAGLLSLLAQSGLHIPARDAVLPVFASILADIGDHQSIAANLSTFSSHISNIREMVDQITLPALVLLDEVGTGTDPEEGAALGIAIVDYFKHKGACVIVSTHYNPLKHYASQTPRVVNASVEFDEKTLRPTYRLLLDIAGTSSGIEIARRLGLQEEILDTATKMLDRRDIHQANFLKFIQTEAERLRQLTAALEEERQVTAQKYEQLEREFAVRDQKRQREFEAELAEVIKRFEKISSELISELKDSAAVSRLSKERNRQISKLKHEAKAVFVRSSQVQANEPPQVLRDFSIGDLVTTELGQQGRIEEINDSDIFVRVGSMRLKAQASNLTPIEKKVVEKTSRKLPAGINLQRREDTNLSSSELNLIGSRVEEALARVDEFLDAAFLEGFDRIRIVHGAGTGRLRRAILDLLKSHPHVATFQQATSSEGGSGATIVELKQ